MPTGWLSVTVAEMAATRYYAWFDTEFTTLELENAHLLQAALVITDRKLHRVVPADEDLVLHFSLSPAVEVSPWVEENLADILRSCRGPSALSKEDVDERLTGYLRRWTGETSQRIEERPVLAGNSIHADWFLLRRDLPRLAGCLHYRHLDVSALKLQWTDWYGGEEFEKADPEQLRHYFPEAGRALEARPHDAYYDVIASIAELSFYRSKLGVIA